MVPGTYSYPEHSFNHGIIFFCNILFVLQMIFALYRTVFNLFCVCWHFKNGFLLNIVLIHVSDCGCYLSLLSYIPSSPDITWTFTSRHFFVFLIRILEVTVIPLSHLFLTHVGPEVETLRKVVYVQFITTDKAKTSRGGGKVSVLWKTKGQSLRKLKPLSH